MRDDGRNANTKLGRGREKWRTLIFGEGGKNGRGRLYT